jgi:AAA+ ATPase superfamily predicted ATPase
VFIGRTAELALLATQLRSRTGAFVPIYGRRRVGKSELILRFVAKQPAVYYLGKQAPARLQIAEFLREAAVALREPLLASYSAQGWKDALDVVVKRSPQDQRLIVALDEFQWMAERSPELPSVLQELWDRDWKSSGRIMLILCGSYVGFMEREILGSRSPLFGRRTAQILLKPFGYLESARFHPGWSLEHRAIAYFICGGVPAYLKTFDEQHSPQTNVRVNLLDEFAALSREPDFLLREELRDVASYHAVLVALATGQRTAKDIAGHTGIAERSLHYYLQQLSELGYVGRRFPLSGRRPAPRSVRYVIEDPLLSFWFRFVFPNRTFITQAGPERAFHERVKPGLAGYFGECFERLCREALPRIYEREQVTAPFAVGEYWDKHVQIDVVGLREDGWTDLGECKWAAVRSVRRLEAELEQKTQRFPNRRGASLARRVFTRTKPRGSGRASWHTLEELYDL